MKWEGRKYAEKQPSTFWDKRVGTNGEDIWIRKIRTMEKCYYPQTAFEMGIGSNGDSRVTRLGKIIRKYDIDELPQFWQVIKGELTLYGPYRPKTAGDIKMLHEERLSKEEVAENKLILSHCKPSLIAPSVIYDRDRMRDGDYKMGHQWGIDLFRNASIDRQVRGLLREGYQKASHAVIKGVRFGTSKIRAKAA